MAHRVGYMIGPDGQPARFYVLRADDVHGDAPAGGPFVLARARILCESVPGSKVVTARQLSALRGRPGARTRATGR
jgi:hypothetical protein